MKIPNAENAYVDLVKLRDYCLSPVHARGRHKARVFEAALGLTADHAEELCEALLTAARTEEAILGDQDEYGQRFLVDFTMRSAGGLAQVRSSWIVRAEEDYPRLITCYVL